MVTDPQRIKRTDPGRPEVCNVCQLHRFFGPDWEEIQDGERTARTGCVDTKKLLADRIIRHYTPARERYHELMAHPAEIDGVKFWGSPHQPWFYDWAFNHPRNGKALTHYWSLIPDDTDVLITHGPPYGILDLPFGKGEPAGCELLLKRVQEVKPRVHVFGHIHGSYGKKQIGRTLFVNVLPP